MKNLFFIRIPSTCICFTLIILVTLLNNLLYGADVSLFPLTLLGWIIICQTIDWLFSFINFKNYLQYCVTESIVLYISSLIIAYLFRWISFTIRNLISFTIIFLIVDILIFWYFKHRQKLLAEEINAML